MDIALYRPLDNSEAALQHKFSSLLFVTKKKTSEAKMIIAVKKKITAKSFV